MRAFFLLLASASAAVLAIWFLARGQSLDLHVVGKVTIEPIDLGTSKVAAKQDEFNALLKKVGTRIDDERAAAERSRWWQGFFRWLRIVLSMVTPVLAAILGIKLPANGGQQVADQNAVGSAKRGAWILCVLLSISAVLQIPENELAENRASYNKTVERLDKACKEAEIKMYAAGDAVEATRIIRDLESELLKE